MTHEGRTSSEGRLEQVVLGGRVSEHLRVLLDVLREHLLLRRHHFLPNGHHLVRGNQHGVAVVHLPVLPEGNREEGRHVGGMG